MADLETLLTYLTLISVPVGVFYYIMTLENTRRNQQVQLETRQLQLYTTGFQPAQSKEFLMSLFEMLYLQEWETYDEFIEKYGPATNPESYASMIQVIELFQMIGLYVERGALNVEVVWSCLLYTSPSPRD